MSTWRKVVCCLATVAVAGVSDTAVAADVNFMWKAAVLSGSWKDGANWDRGTYPNALATDYATFSKGTYEVTVPNGTTNKYIQLVTDVTLKLKGVRDENGAQAQMRSGAVRYTGGSYSRCNLIVDDLYYFYDNSGTTSGSDSLGANSSLVLTNGSTFIINGAWPLQFTKAGDQMSLYGKSAFTFKGSSSTPTFTGSGSGLVLDDSTYTLTSASKGLRMNGGTEAQTYFIFRGDAPAMVVAYDCGIGTTGSPGALLQFEPPVTGWEAAAIRGGTCNNSPKFAAANSLDRGNLFVEVPRSAPIWKCATEQEVPLVSWNKGINPAVFRFGALRNEGSYFHWDDETNPKVLYLHVVPADQQLDFKLTSATATEIAYEYSVNDEGLAGAAATLEYSQDEDFSGSTEISLGTVDLPADGVTGSVAGLQTGTTYYLRLKLVKDAVSVVRTQSTTTTAAAGSIADTVKVVYASGEDPAFTGSVDVFGAGDIHTVKLMLGTDPENLEEVASLDITEAGEFTISGPWKDYYCVNSFKIVYENGDGSQIWTSETSVNTYTPTYTATYTWKSAVAEGLWADANWTISGSTATNPTKPFPCQEAYHSAVFSGTATNTILLSGGESCLYLQPGANKAAAILKGTGDSPTSVTFGALRWNNKTGVNLTLDNVAMNWTAIAGAMDAGQDSIGTDSRFCLRNGTSITIDNKQSFGVIFGNSTKLTVELRGGSFYDFRPNHLQPGRYSMNMSAQSTVLLENSKMRVGAPLSLCNGGSAAIPATWTFEGTNAQLVATMDFGVTGAAGVNLVFRPGKGGFSAPAIAVSNKVAFAASSYGEGPVTVSVPKDAEIWSESSWAETTLISAPKGINTNVIRFAELKRPGGSFLYLPEGTDNPTSLVFRLRKPGFILILK